MQDDLDMRGQRPRYYFFIIFLIMNIVSCQKSIILKPGKYDNLKNSHEFFFYSDSSFYYKYYGMGTKFSIGRWSILEKNILLLNSEIQNDMISLTIDSCSQKDTLSSISVFIKSNSNNDEKDYKCIPFVNLSEYPFFDTKNGKYKISSDSIRFLQFKIAKIPQKVSAGNASIFSIILDTETVNISPQFDYKITVNVIDSLFRYRVFTNEKLKIKGNKIIFNDGKDKNILYFKKE